MKALKLTFLLLTVLALNCCDKDDGNYLNSMPPIQRTLFLSFKDASGNDLAEELEFEALSTVKGLGLIKNLYTLKIVDDLRGSISMQLKRFTESVPSVFANGTLTPDDIYLIFGDAINIISKFNKKLIFRLTCPDLFGDNEAHDITSWWKLVNYNDPVCYRLEFDGKEFAVKGQREYTATIILDR
jgi:hypothetical protein